MKVLNRNEMKTLKGGVAPAPSGNCGSYIDGQWYEIEPLTSGGGTKQYAIDNLTNGSGATR